MRVTTKAFILNLVCFAVLFFFFRFILLLLDLPYLLAMLLAAILASLGAPKFMVKKEVMWVKFPWRKMPYKC
jgi:hypothetical protein